MPGAERHSGHGGGPGSGGGGPGSGGGIGGPGSGHGGGPGSGGGSGGPAPATAAQAPSRGRHCCVRPSPLRVSNPLPETSWNGCYPCGHAVPRLLRCRRTDSRSRVATMCRRLLTQWSAAKVGPRHRREYAAGACATRQPTRSALRERSAGHHPTPAAGHRWLTDDPSIETTCPRRRRWPPKHRAMIRPLRHGGYGARRCVNR